MATVDLPSPRTRPQSSPSGPEEALARDLAARVDGEVRFDAGSRAAYAVDASNYRQVPIGVVVPRTVDAGVAALAVCREHDVPVLSRGGGTSLAGQCCNAAVVIDWSKYCTRIVSVDEAQRTCVVEPGIKLDDLNAALPGRLIYGPKPATHVSCTLGGMIGNNSCGSTAQVFGKVADNVRRLEVLTYDGLRMWVGPTSDEEYAAIQAEGGRRAEIYRGLRAIAADHAQLVAERFPDIPRRVSGYNLDDLVPGSSFDLARALVGSESTLVTVLHAELDLVTEAPHTALVVLGFDDVVAAARSVDTILPHTPHFLECIDRNIVEFERAKGVHQRAMAAMPAGHSWLMAQMRDDDADRARERARALAAALEGTCSVLTVTDGAEQAELFAIRESALAVSARDPRTGIDNYEGWEDAALPTDRLADYMAEWVALVEEYGFTEGTAIYGHFGHGCIHTRIPFDLRTPAGVAAYRTFMERSADLCVKYGGSLSGEHGDGQSRGELLERMYGPELVRAFESVKALFDPRNRMNPGKVVHPYRLDEHLHVGADYDPADPPSAFAYPADDGRFTRAVERCIGVGRCRRTDGDVMCPSYRVTGEEHHSTRGRARLLWEMLRGHADSPIRDGWRSTEVRDALDLCLACKGCLSDCPVNVDMATYKAEFLHHHHAGRPWTRPRSHLSMGWLPALARVASPVAPLVNRLTSSRAAGLLKRAGGIDARRTIPTFATPRFSHWYRARGPFPHGGTATRGEVLLWPDTFTEFLHPRAGADAVRVLEAAGFRVRLPERELCCGLTWVTTGQLDVAERVLGRTLDALAPAVGDGMPIVGLEPSCTAVFTDDAPNLLPGPRADAIAAATTTLGRLLAERAPDWTPPGLAGRDVIVQQHCHQHATGGYGAETAVLQRAGAEVEVLDSGCCGLAGNFGFEQGHYEVSVACGEQVLLPRVRGAAEDTAVVADGFSCRTQIDQLTTRRGDHLASLLASGLPPEDLPWPS
ncbi:FAD-binding and (Fe-S)-binding domain-containing protein [Actinomycetospora straminea]|uniref:FAD-binding and (Fe-S)-binding domain-containing protein n=1 Tax=Actinomycetospora straminea TaxID=663607 RepID=A0ABP9DZX8_9PSEU|nr:FAD-binding and (Fe-S)-binding domain-containing protein [Actinomycetospora straminea]MDD7934288.1 FAD-binding and (Fe-S)-binding domain-containing protein [Actinomycetospora straminea]